MANYLIFLVSLFSFSAFANEMFSVDPTNYMILGKDSGGNEAYSLSFEIKRENKFIYTKSLKVSVYGKTLNVSQDLLKEVINPDLVRISAINDSGVSGSYFSISIPFGNIKKCKGKEIKKTLYISTMGGSENEPLKASIYNACKSP